jgi:trans-aconitate 2-methyltransferase
MKYTYGTSTIARDRLRLIADFFNPLADDLVKSHIPIVPHTALDIGCGPGFTTDMLAHATGARLVCGIDSSEDFLRDARHNYPRYEFIRHDVTELPFPIHPDAMYVRFVLSHLDNPVRRINDWTTQLVAGGFIFVDETEAVESDLSCFATYLSVNEAIVASQGARLFVGNEIAVGSYESEVIANECSILRVPDRLAASWFLPNVNSIWMNNLIVDERLTGPEVIALREELTGLASSRGDSSRITWKMRWIVLKSASSSFFRTP